MNAEIRASLLHVYEILSHHQMDRSTWHCRRCGQAVAEIYYNERRECVSAENVIAISHVVRPTLFERSWA